MIKTKAPLILATFIVIGLTASAHLANAQTALSYQHPSQASPVPQTGPITALTAPISTDTTRIGNAIAGTLPTSSPVTTTSISTPGNSIISDAQKASMYTQTETQISVMQSQLTSISTSSAATTTSGAAQIAALNTSISNCQTRASLLSGTTGVTGNQLNTYHCP